MKQKTSFGQQVDSPQEGTMQKTIFAQLLKTAAHYPEHPFLCVPPLAGRHYHPHGMEWTYGQVKEKVLALKLAYERAGYGLGHRVGLLLENRPEHVLHLLALNALGVGAVPINPEYRHEELLYQMEHCEAELVVSIAERVAALEQVSEARTEPLAVVNGEALPHPFPPPRTAAQKGTPDLHTETSLFYTSGTTGHPKGCICSNFYFLNAGQWYAQMGHGLSIAQGKERLYNPLPLFHINAGAIGLCAMLLTGGCLILPDRFHPKSWWQEIIATQATIIHYLGVVPPLLMNQPKIPQETEHGVKFGVGAGIEPELHDAFEQRFGFPLIEVWGMTETGRILADHIEPRRTTTRAFGKPNAILEAKVVDDNDQELPAHHEGELLVRAAGDDPRRGFFSGYLKNATATAEAWRGGWFHTGDVVRQGEDGMLYFVDRKKNIIRRSGENIAAAEVEATLQGHDQVAQIAVIAAPDELREEEVMACILLMPRVQPSKRLAESLFDWCAQRLAYYKVPGWFLFMDALPTTSTQKVQKTKIFPKGIDPRTQSGSIDLRSRKKKGA